VRRRGFGVFCKKQAFQQHFSGMRIPHNPTEGEHVQTAAYRQKLAEEIAAGVRVVIPLAPP
jgi:hypothetical protein